ncbi:MAG: urea carboxylase-associated family protein [Rhizobiaceae bacterium]
MSRSQFATIDAGAADGFHLTAGSKLRLINTTGSQVVGTWAFTNPDLNDYMSMEHTRIHSTSSRPQLGTIFYTNMHNPILEICADRSPGVHDWFLAACNQNRYELLGHQGQHANCTDNFHAVLDKVGRSHSYVPCPLNLFENVSMMFRASMEIKNPVAMPGDYVDLKALSDCFVVLSSCPQDMLPTNGPDLTPNSVEVEIMEA